MLWPRPIKYLTKYLPIAITGLITPLLASAFLPNALLPDAWLPSAVAQSTGCPAALDRMQQHRVQPGETLASIAENYRLQPATLSQFNPGIGSSVSAGVDLIIPPFNGVVVGANASDTWQTLAERHGSRADLLFEVNGCTRELPSRVFVPVVNPIAATVRQPTTLELPGYPLGQPTNIRQGYGWQPHSTRDELVFFSGIAFDIANDTDVLAVGDGTVAFAGEREGYGLFVVINHDEGLQTRYANLSNISVSVGQPVTVSTAVGSVGTEAPTFLYFEVRTNSASGWIAQDPGKYLPALELR
ncbi:MAG: M23 family metallopeptidase [Cyanobacteria bacterium J06649_4]